MPDEKMYDLKSNSGTIYFTCFIFVGGGGAYYQFEMCICLISLFSVTNGKETQMFLLNVEG